MSTDLTVKAVSIDHREGKVAVATLGRAADPAVGERIIRSIDQAEHDPAAQGCRLLQPDAGCRTCEHSRGSVPAVGFTVREAEGVTTVARVSCPTSPTLWRWREFVLPKIAPRQVQIPETEEEFDEWKWQAVAAAGCAGFGLAAYFTGPSAGSMFLYAAAYVAGAWFAAHEAWERFRSRTLDVHFLMLTVAAGSAAVGAWGEGAMLLFLFATSGALEHYAMGRTQREIRSLFRSAPKTALRLDADGRELTVPVETIEAGHRLLIKPGSQFPVDAEIAKGRTASDESNLTGEAVPVEKAVGDIVLAGTLNLWGAVEAVVLRPVRESALERIVRLIREAQHLKAPSQRFTDRFGTGYTYAILGLSLAMFFVWWLGLNLPPFVSTATTRSAFYHTMTLLVVASPCALVLSIPSAILAAIAWGARRGILFRGGAAIEKLSEVSVVALDKTGTLTTGELQVEQVDSLPSGREPEVTRLAFSMERLSTHPLARAITRHGKRNGLVPIEFEHYQSLTGLGIEAARGPERFLLGKRELIESALRKDPQHAHLLSRLPDAVPGLSEVWVWHGDLLGRVTLRDDIRPQSARVVAALRRFGLRAVVLTGDRASSAQLLQQRLGLDDVRPELRPEQKVEVIRKLTEAGQRVAMIGDGVNDAPSLAAAHVGVAMGARGSDAALEQAEIVLMHDRLENFLAAFRLSQQARTVIRQNLVVALGTVTVLVGFALLGQIPLTVGVLGHEGSTVVVVLNSLRLLFLRAVEETDPTQTEGGQAQLTSARKHAPG